MTYTTKTEALRLADELAAWASDYATTDYTDEMATKAAAEFRRLSAERDRLAAECEALRAFVTRVAEQKPEKPDYWSSCGQCDHNISDAQDLIDAAMGGKESQGGNASGQEGGQ